MQEKAEALSSSTLAELENTAESLAEKSKELKSKAQEMAAARYAIVDYCHPLGVCNCRREQEQKELQRLKEEQQKREDRIKRCDEQNDTITQLLRSAGGIKDPVSHCDMLLHV